MMIDPIIFTRTRTFRVLGERALFPRRHRPAATRHALLECRVEVPATHDTRATHVGYSAGAMRMQEAADAYVYAHDQLARVSARDSCVLLQNDGTLPLRKSGQKIALVGWWAEDKENAQGAHPASCLLHT
jgi:beta-glucosidase-like glycosyl hydrolase